MKAIKNEVLALTDLAEHVLLAWLEIPPAERREKQALDLLADAAQSLYAACINLGLKNVE